MFLDTYRRAFQEEDTSIFWGQETINRSWDDGTLLFYFTIVLFTIIIGWQIESRKINIKKKILKGRSTCYPFIRYKSIRIRAFFFFSFLALIAGLRRYTVGIDTIVYRNAIDEVVSFSRLISESSLEPLFVVIQYLIYFIFRSGSIGIFIYSSITLFFIYGGIKRYFDSINIYVCFLVYTCLYFFPSMNLIRITLAASFIFYNFHYLLEQKYSRFLLIILLTTLVHYSTIVMLFPLLVYYFYKKNKILAFVGTMLLMGFIITFVYILSDYIALLNRYSGYIDNNDSSGHVGIMLFLTYLPALMCCFYIVKKKIKSIWADLTICFSLSAFSIRFLAYFIVAAGRLQTHFMILTLLLLPYWVGYLAVKSPKYYKLFMIICTIWALFRLHIYFMEYLSLDGIMPYKLCF